MRCAPGRIDDMDDAVFHRDYESMDNDELTQLQEAYQKLRVSLPPGLHHELELRAFTKKLEELDDQPSGISSSATTVCDAYSAEFDIVADAQSDLSSDHERFVEQIG